MDHFEQLKDIWRSHDSDRMPSLTSINHAIKAYQKEKRKNTAFIVLLLLMCILAMIYVMMQYHSHFWSTRIGEVLFVLIAIYLVISKYALLQKNVRDEILNTNEYLDDLKKKTQKTAYNKIHPILYMVLASAFSLYVYEMLSQNKTRLITGYTLLFLFLSFMWFVYRPIMERRQNHKIQTLLNKIDLIKNQTYEKS